MGGRGVTEAQDEGLSLQEKQCTQKLPSLSRVKAVFYKHQRGIEKPLIVLCLF